MAEGINAKKTKQKNNTVATTTVQKESEDGLVLGCLLFCALVFFGLGPGRRTITWQIRSLATVEICITGVLLIGRDGLRFPGEFWKKTDRVVQADISIIVMCGSVSACVVALTLKSVDVTHSWIQTNKSEQVG